MGEISNVSNNSLESHVLPSNNIVIWSCVIGKKEKRSNNLVNIFIGITGAGIIHLFLRKALEIVCII